MKTSLLAPAAALQSVKADAPQQLKSVTVYFRGRKMVLMQRPQRRLSLLLCRMLRRSMLNLLGRLPMKLAAPVKKALSAGALCAMALASATSAHATATVDTLPVNTLPTNPAVVYGTVGIGTTGNQMNVDIGTNKAIINWGSFSIGSQAGVDFHFDNATSTSSVLNRVIGNDPSKIMGSLTSNGKVFLINSAGILVGKTAKIDVAGFVASTLNITNSDFLAGKMSFNDQHRHHRPAGDVVIEEDGAIKTKEGGSVYLIGANVENGGVITSPKGEVLLAAGHSVDLVDTGTPGVKINVKGDKGKVTNLGKIIAETGTIGFGAALINNSGMINASSVDNVGGRIFLRASKDLTTTETSSINADGTTGGNVILYADDTAKIDGDVSALGSAGNGGYVDTSGKQALSVKYAPRIGAGGEWLIDPANISIVNTCDLLCIVGGALDGVLSISLGNVTEMQASSISDQLNNGTTITIATSDHPGTAAGNITIENGVTISKGHTGGAATLILKADNDITIGDNVVIGDDGTPGKGLNLQMFANSSQDAQHNYTSAGDISVGTNTTINVSNGFEAHALHYDMTGGNLTSSSGTFNMDAALTADSSAHITINNVNGTAKFKGVSIQGNSSLAINNSTAALDTITLVGAGTNVMTSNSTLTSNTTVFNNGTSFTASSGSNVSLGVTTIGTGDVTFDNSKGTFDSASIDSGGSLTVKNGSQVTTAGNITGAGTLNIGDGALDTSSLDAGTNTVTVNDLNLQSGSLIGAGGTGKLTVNGSFTQSGGSIHFDDVDVTQDSGTLSTGDIEATHSISLVASDGAIAQNASTKLKASQVNATATAGIALTNATNAVATFVANNSTSGDIAYSGAGDLALGVIDNGTRHVTITETRGKVTQAGAMTAGNVTVSASSGHRSHGFGKPYRGVRRQ